VCVGMNADESRSNQRFTVAEAAKRLNVSEAAIRQRIQRESIAYEKDEATNRVYIILDEEENRLDNVEHRSERELIDTLQEQLRLEREASAELRRIVAGLVQRVPELEAPSEARESPESAGEGYGSTQTREEPQETISRPWWRRVFGG
jgi:hypothetical protein